LTMKILLLSRYSHIGPSSRVRFYQYLPYLSNQGIHVTVANLLRDEYLEDLYAGRRRRLCTISGAYIRRLSCMLASKRFDLLWVEGEILPWLPAWAEKIFSNSGIPYVVDYDDALFHRYNMHPRFVVRALLGRKIDEVMRQAALVIVGNQYLGDYARKVGANRVEHIPSAIDLDRYSDTPAPRNPIFTIGWIGSPITNKYLNLTNAALAEVCKDGSARLVLVGSGSLQLDGVPTEINDWSEETEVAGIQSFDVGIMPLSDDLWSQGKCGYKLIQYMACGRPVVASKVGVNLEIVEDGISGFLVNNKDGWVQALNVLRKNSNLRQQMGKSGRIKVETKYCIQVTAPRLISLLYSAVEGRT
jgi:glycosyltransferase involved in cell wall biosynthesis